ncbi:MAG TPA: glycosyltransferase family 87 protein [bacterium]|nr:glycosyltransferase family 87 protein [bacterium]HPN29577.1 glycosyltransferase family 87 protein [bacterium]
MNKKFFFVTLIFVFIFFIFISLRSVKQSWMVDLKANITAADNLLQSKELYYFKPYNGGFTYLPAVSVLYMPARFINKEFGIETAKIIWTLFNICLVFVSLIILRNAGCFKNKTNFSILLFVIIFIFFRPLYDNIRYGNIKIVLLTLYLLLFQFREKDGLSGIIWGILVVLSVQPVLLSPYFIFRRKFKTVFYAALTFFGIVLMSLIIVPYSEYVLYFTEVIPQLQFEGASSAPYIQSFDAMCRRLFLAYNEYTIELLHSPFLAVKFPVIIKSFFFLLTIFVLYLRRRLPDADYFQFSIMFICMILMHSINWEYHYTIVLTAVAVYYKNNDFISEFFKVFRKSPKSCPQKKDKTDLLFLIFCSLIFFYYPYDHKFFLRGFPVVFTNLKLFALTGIYGIFLFKLLSRNS